MVQVHLERRADPGEHEADEQARRRADRSRRKTALAKGEAGIKDRKPAPTLADFAGNDFLPFVRGQFAAKPKTLAYYENGVARLLDFERLSSERLDAITGEHVAAYVSHRRAAAGRCGKPLQVSRLNRELQVLRRMFHLAQEWRKADRALPEVKMIPGENHRERVLTPAEEDLYFRAASTPAMEQFADAALLRDVAAVLVDCGLRPEECFRLRRENVMGGVLEVLNGKTENARRRIPMTARVKAVLEMRLSAGGGRPWVFPVQTKSGHIEPSSLKKQHARAIKEASKILRQETGYASAELAPFELYTFRHTCLTRWVPHVDPFHLSYLAGHRDMNITKRYIHPEEHSIRAAMEKARGARGGHNSRHTAENADLEAMPVSTTSI